MANFVLRQLEPYAPGSTIHLELRASNKLLALTQDFYCHPQNVQELGEKLVCFSGHPGNEVRWEVGGTKHHSLYHVRVEAFVGGSAGPTILTIHIDDRRPEWFRNLAEVSIICDTASVNQLGRVLVAWTPEKQDDLEWLPTVDHERIGDLLCNSGFQRDFAHKIQLFRGRLSREAERTRTLAKEITATVTPQGSVEDLVGLLLGDGIGAWIYAGWHDQAALHWGIIRSGDAGLCGSMLTQFDEDQVDEGGDMLVAFVRPNHDWVLAIEVSPGDSVFDVRLYTDSESDAKTATNLIESANGE